MFFMFTGQGSQFVGMGKSFCGMPEMKMVLEEIDEAISFKLSTLMLEGDESELQKTENAQPAILAVSIGIMRVVSARFNIKLDMMAGHSAGEYSALHAASSLSLADAARILRIRGKSMQNACQIGYGAMAAILGMEFEQVRDIVSSLNCYVANDNGARQVVISGEKEAVLRAAAELKKNGALRAVELNVSAPFHTPLMQQAVKPLEEALATIDILVPRCEVVSNVTARPYKNVDEIRDLLAKQVCGTVRWRETMQFVSSSGIKSCIEFGPSAVLSKLAPKISANLEAISICEEADLQRLELFIQRACEEKM